MAEFSGVFKGVLWGNFRSGDFGFIIETRNEGRILPSVCVKEEKMLLNPFTGENERYYSIVCHATRMETFDVGTPLMVEGVFSQNKKDSNKSYILQVSSIGIQKDDPVLAVKYLSTLVQPSDAKKIVQLCGADVYHYPEQKEVAKQIEEATSLDKGKVKELMQRLQSAQEERELFSWLGQYDVPYTTCIKAIKNYGTNAKELFKRRPYETGRSLGLSYKACEKIATAEDVINCVEWDDKTCAVTREASYRMEARGNCYESMRQFMNDVDFVTQKKASSAGVYAEQAKGLVDVMQADNGLVVTNHELFEAESRIAENIKRLESTARYLNPVRDMDIDYAEKVCGMRYGEQQKAAFAKVLCLNGICILTGGPGTGKTTTVKGIITAYEKLNPGKEVLLCATTARAAQRLSESTGIPATTVHRMLEYRKGATGIQVCKDRSNQITADFIIIDEMSMMDVRIFDLLLEAVKTGVLLLLVGDPNQLESVGAGAILRDLLQNPTLRQASLTEVFRQKGGSPIIENAVRIQQKRTDMQITDDFLVFAANTAAEAKEMAVNLCVNGYQKDDPFATQILCPAKKGEAGILELNKTLQNLLNPNPKGVVRYGKNEFRVGDKILMIKNNYELDYFNGDIGIVKKASQGKLTVEIRGKEILLEKDLLEEVCLAYAMTIHKSQGSEFPNVIIVMPDDTPSLLVINLFYTAVTRAKKSVSVINLNHSMEKAIQTDHTNTRNTWLRNLL